MPGAYEKLMWSDRFKQMQEIVKSGRDLLETQQYSSLLLHHIPLLLHEVVPTKNALEDFCYANGLTFLCDILLLKAQGRFCNSVLPILQKFSLLLCKEHATYDENIGDVPLLVYFLTERHKYYVDINWMSHELTLMKKFCMALLAVISIPTDECDPTSSATRDIGIDVLYITLLTFPPHRVVAQMAACFHSQGWVNVLKAIQNATSFWTTVKGCCRLLQLINSIVSFGLGWPLQKELPQFELQWNIINWVGLNARCPCRHCELRRHFRKVAKNRDEFGVIEAMAAKKKIVRCFVEVDGLSLICDIMDRINLKAKQSNGTKTCKILSVTSNSSITNNVPDADDYLYWGEVAKECAGCTILMCSWEYGEQSMQNILSYSNYSPLVSLLSAIDLSDVRSIFNPENCVFQPGSEFVLRITSALILRSDEVETRNALLRRSKSTFEVIFRRLVAGFIHCCGDHGSAFTYQKGLCLHILVALLLLLHIEGRDNHHGGGTKNISCDGSGCFSSHSYELPLYHKLNSNKQESYENYIHINKSHFEAAVIACQSFYDGLDVVMCEKESDRLAYLTLLLLLMAILLGVIDYNSSPPNRKRFAKAPSILCGWMTTAARNIYDRYNKSVRGDECILIKELSSVVISRAEKASAIIPANSVDMLSLRENIFQNGYLLNEQYNF